MSEAMDRAIAEFRKLRQPKILVPEGMRLAAGKALNDIDPQGYMIHLGLEAALRWLDDELVSMRKAPERCEHNYAIEAVRRLYLIQPNPVVEKVKQTVMGTTLTNSEANEITKTIWDCVRPTGVR